MGVAEQIAVCVQLLMRVVQARGGDPAQVAAQYGVNPATPPPTGMVPLAPLLTGPGQPR